jgi:hypothetical protein
MYSVALNAPALSSACTGRRCVPADIASEVSIDMMFDCSYCFTPSTYTRITLIGDDPGFYRRRDVDRRRHQITTMRDVVGGDQVPAAGGSAHGCMHYCLKGSGAVERQHDSYS